MNPAQKDDVRVYHYPLSPFCRKLRLVLAEKQIDFVLREERYWERRAEFTIVNPAGTVPLMKKGSAFLSDSQAICEFLEAEFPVPVLIPNDKMMAYETRRLVYWFDDKFNREVTSKLVFERMLRRIQGKGPPDASRVSGALRRLLMHMQYLHYLLDSRRWIAGERMTMADFAAAAHLSCLDYLNDVNWEYSSTIKDWYSTLKSRPAFRPLLSDYIPGVRPPPHYSDLDF